MEMNAKTSVYLSEPQGKIKKTAREGLEPSLRGPEPRVLPLDDRASTRIHGHVVFKYTLINRVCQFFHENQI